MKTFLTSNDWKFRLFRTILQGVIGVLIANLDLLVSYLNFDPAMKTVMVAICMAILSPVMAELGKSVPDELDMYFNDTAEDIDSEDDTFFGQNEENE